MQPIYIREQFRVERFGKRDEAFFLYAHGTWGFDARNMMPDFMEIDANNKAVLVGDLKFCPPKGKEFSILTDQADVYRANFTCGSIYLFYWFFTQDNTLMRAEDVPNLKNIISSCQFMPVCLDHHAQNKLGKWDRQPMTEYQWVYFLHHIRGIKMPKAVSNTLTREWQQVTLPTIQGKLK